jgi:hypothetical protein
MAVTFLSKPEFEPFNHVKIHPLISSYVVLVYIIHVVWIRKVRSLTLVLDEAGASCMLTFTVSEKERQYSLITRRHIQGLGLLRTKRVTHECLHHPRATSSYQMSVINSSPSA